MDMQNPEKNYLKDTISLKLPNDLIEIDYELLEQKDINQFVKKGEEKLELGQVLLVTVIAHKGPCLYIFPVELMFVQKKQKQMEKDKAQQPKKETEKADSLPKEQKEAQNIKISETRKVLFQKNANKMIDEEIISETLKELKLQLKELRNELVTKLQSVSSQKTSNFLKDFDVSFNNLMKDFSEAYKNEISSQNQKYWVNFIEKALKSVYEKYSKCQELSLAKQLQLLETEKQKVQSFDDKLKVFFQHQLQFINQLKENFEEFIQINDDFYQSKKEEQLKGEELESDLKALAEVSFQQQGQLEEIHQRLLNLQTSLKNKPKLNNSMERRESVNILEKPKQLNEEIRSQQFNQSFQQDILNQSLPISLLPWQHPQTNVQIPQLIPVQQQNGPQLVRSNDGKLYYMIN